MTAVYLWIGSGSADEGAHELGAAHFLEHMVFKGTSRRGMGESAAAVEAFGGDINAFTSFHETVLHATVPSDAWAEALDVLADMALAPVLDPGELERERLVVLEEIRGYADDPETVVEEAAMAGMYGTHPYGRPITGTFAGVQRLTRDGLRGFMERRWTADRAVVAVCGDLDPAAVVDEARRLLGGWRAATRPGSVATPGPLKGPSLIRAGRGFESAVVELGWRAVPVGHADAAALDVLSVALADGAASLLTGRLQHDAEVATDTWSTLVTEPAGGYLSVGFLPRQARTLDAVQEALDEIDLVRERGLPGTAVHRARESILTDALFSAETVDGAAHDLAWYAARYGDPDARGAYHAAVAAVTPDDVAGVARRWLTPKNLVTTVLDDEVALPRLKRVVHGRRTAVPARGGRVQARLRCGARLVVLPEDSPIAAVHVVGLGGDLACTGRLAGLTSAWARTVTAGAGDLDAEAFAEATDHVAGTIDAFSSRSAMGVAATFPSWHLLGGLDLIASVLSDPWFDHEEWERVREEMVEEVETLPDRAEEQASNAAWAAWYRDHPWRFPITGSQASLAAISPAALKKLHRRLIAGDNLVITVVGRVEPRAVVERLEDLDLPARTKLHGRVAPPPPQHLRRRIRAGRSQAHVVLSTRGIAYDHPDRLALQLALTALDGQGGRLFLSLRERLGLAYSVWASASSGTDGGLVQIGLATDPARLEEARLALAAEVSDLVRRPPNDEEVARCRRRLVGQRAMSLQRASGRALDVAMAERFGLPRGLAGFTEAVSRVGAADVARTVRRVLAGPPLEITTTPLD